MIGQKQQNTFSKLTWKISQLKRHAGEQACKQVDFSSQAATFHSFGQLFQQCMLHFSSWANVYQILINHFFIFTEVWLYIIHVSQHVSFSISQRLVSVKNKLFQSFMETSQFIFQFAQGVRRLWLLKTSFLGKTGLGVRWMI